LRRVSMWGLLVSLDCRQPRRRQGQGRFTKAFK
jgi:hypothetical protein